MNRATVYDIAWDFLVALEAERRAEPRRPVLFVVHSLGGIVVKEMLRRSGGCYLTQRHLRDVFESTVGIVFFGTPHGGADPRGLLQHIAEKAIKAAGFSVNEQIVNTLLPSAERLRELRDEFGPIAQEQNWMVHSFQEQLGVGLLNGHKVVEDTSSYLNLPAVEITEHIERNHMDICRFTGLDDIEYRNVASALHRLTGSISNSTGGALKPALDINQKHLLLDSLKFDQMDARRMTVKNAHAKTCKWLLEKSEYRSWLDVSMLHDHRGFLWIKGKPGTGKSTLMKFALANANKTMKKTIITSFFFNARGQGLEKSTMGTYQSLLCQLLQRLPRLQNVFDSLELSASGIGQHRQWSMESLKTLLEQAILSLGDSPLVCFIDALDECDESQIREMISFFEHVCDVVVAAGIRTQICLSSRHYPHISIKHGLILVLEGQEGHGQDIMSYIDSELKIGHSKVAQQVRTELQEKAAGVFMWVVLVVGILNKEHDGGRIRALRRRLQEIPGDLHELFRNMLTRDTRNREQLLLCIQWVLFASQPLRREQLYFAIISGTEADDLSAWDHEEDTVDIIERFILDCSKGLTEITKSKIPVVQFIHESVRDFLLKEKGLEILWPDHGVNTGHSHERLKQCCLNYLKLDVAKHLKIPTDLPKASSADGVALRNSVTSAFPFLEYAVRNALHHADLAESGGISQDIFIQSFDLDRWVKLDNLVEQHHIRRHGPGVTMLYILAENNLSYLIRAHPTRQSFTEEEEQRYYSPVFAALATDSRDALDTFLSLAGRSAECSLHIREGRKFHFGRDFEFGDRATLVNRLARIGDVCLFTLLLDHGCITSHCKNRQKKTPLHHASEHGQDVMVDLLLRTGAVDLEAKDASNMTALLYAIDCFQSNDRVLRLLLANGAKVNYGSPEKGNGQSVEPLLRAICRKKTADLTEILLDNGAAAITDDRMKIIETLLEYGVDPNHRDEKSGETALGIAAFQDHKAICELLLVKGADPAVRDVQGRTPLFIAAEQGHLAVAALLLESGAQVDSEDGNGRTPLFSAVCRTDKDTVQLLLTKGAAVDPRNDQDETLFFSAVAEEHDEIAQALLDRGANINVRNTNGDTSLSIAAQRGKLDTVKLLLERGAKVDLKNRDGRTPLSIAVQFGYFQFHGPLPGIHNSEFFVRHYSIVQLLIEAGAEIDTRDEDGQTPLLIVCRWFVFDETAKLLLDNGATVNCQNVWGETPLFWATKYGDVCRVSLLLERGADPNLETSSSKTPLSVAESGNGWEPTDTENLTRIKELLLAHGATRKERDVL